MNTNVALLRGINVGGRRKIKMADLTQTCQNLGWKNVTTYIQSGNIIFESKKTISSLENELQNSIKKEYGFDVPVMVRSQKEFNSVIKNNPFYQTAEDLDFSYLTFLKELPSEENLNKILNLDIKPDQFLVDGKNGYLHIKGKFHESKLTNAFFEKKLQVLATTRNWKTVLKLKELME